MAHTITINKPMVLIPVEEYINLLKEIGKKPTPKLVNEIRKSRDEFRKGKTVKWDSLKNELRI